MLPGPNSHIWSPVNSHIDILENACTIKDKQKTVDGRTGLFNKNGIIEE